LALNSLLSTLQLYLFLFLLLQDWPTASLNLYPYFAARLIAYTNRTKVPTFRPENGWRFSFFIPLSQRHEKAKNILTIPQILPAPPAQWNEVVVNIPSWLNAFGFYLTRFKSRHI